jgi:putative transport protein
METFRSLLASNEPLRLFVVIGLGYLLGQLKVRGVGLGVAGVLFVGLVVGAIGRTTPSGAPAYALNDIVAVLGLVIFLYTLGLQAGPGFFSAFRAEGLRLAGVTAAAIGIGAALTWGSVALLEVPRGMAVGLFCGGLTNTPALAATLDTLRRTSGSPLGAAAGAPTGAEYRAQVSPTIGYSIAYPFGVLGVVLAARFGVRLFRLDLRRERGEFDKKHAPGELLVRHLRVTKKKPNGNFLEAGWVSERSGAVLVRYRHDGITQIVGPETVLEPGDIVIILGTQEAIDRTVEMVGELASDEHLEIARPDIEYHRILVSNRSVVGKRIADLHIEAYGGIITRVRRADIEVAGTPNTVLELGDRVRVVAYTSSLEKIVNLLGDSIRTIAETDFLPLAFGLSLGVLVGMIPIPVPFGNDLRLGVAGGPLLVALVLGRLGKTGRIIWGLPMEVNFTLRQFGLILFLAAVGLKAGGEVLESLRPESAYLFAVGAALTTAVALATLVLGRLVLKLNAVDLFGVLAGVHTQPAALAFANRLTESDGTSLAYASVHPLATILKILAAQIMISLL